LKGKKRENELNSCCSVTVLLLLRELGHTLDRKWEILFDDSTLQSGEIWFLPALPGPGSLWGSISVTRPISWYCGLIFFC
jgi:hypothetical protein